MFDTFGISQAAEISNVTRQAVYVAIRQGRLEAAKEGRWQITAKALDEYKKNRWNRMNSIVDGKPLVSKEKGEYLARQIAENLNIPVQKLYYDIRCNKIKYSRRGNSYIITLEDAIEYKNKFLKDKYFKKAVA